MLEHCFLELGLSFQGTSAWTHPMPLSRRGPRLVGTKSPPCKPTQIHQSPYNMPFQHVSRETLPPPLPVSGPLYIQCGIARYPSVWLWLDMGVSPTPPSDGSPSDVSRETLLGVVRHLANYGVRCPFCRASWRTPARTNTGRILIERVGSTHTTGLPAFY